VNFLWLPDVSPFWGSVLYALGFFGLILWTLRWRSDAIYEGAPDHARWRDLRLWIIPLALIQIALYLAL
jgi:hypothetical protein